MSHLELHDELESLAKLLNSVSEAKHSLRVGKDKKDPFPPTSFMYMFATFNTLYNINWEETFEKGKFVYYVLGKNGPSQTDMINQMLSFCYNDARWDTDYINKFLGNLKGGKENIVKTLKGFELDKPYYGSCVNLYETSEQPENRGCFTEEKQKTKFIKAVDDLLNNKNVTQDNLKTITTTIYGVRCNIFHGVKGFNLMKDDKQEERLVIYTNILYAICNMVLHYANEEYKKRYFVQVK